MSLAVPWPLKVILDSVVGNHPPPQWIGWLLPALGGQSKVHIAEAAAIDREAEAIASQVVIKLNCLIFWHYHQLLVAIFDN